MAIKTKKAAPKSRAKKISNSVVSNGLQEAILGSNIQGLGTQLSQTTTLFKNLRWYMVSNLRQLLSQIYVEHGLIQTVVDVPVDDGLRGGVEIKSKQLSPEQIEELQIAMERSDILNTSVGQALKWNRLYGGAAILILTDQNPEEPLNVKAIQSDSAIEFRAVDMWELFNDRQNIEGDGTPVELIPLEFYNYYGKKIHKSRVMSMKGLTPPSFIRPRLRGWGFSIVEALVRSINQYLKANDLTFEVLDEFKIDYYKIKNLTSTLMSSSGTESIQKRVQIANMQKNFQRAVTMDSEDDFIQKQLSFSGIAETMTGIRMQVASDLRMPLTKVFGISAAGFSSGQEDLENYNAMVEAQVRAKCKYDILRVIEIMCQKHFQFIPDDLRVEFKPLRMLSAEQEENVKTQQFNRLLAAKQAGELTSQEFRDACNKDGLLSIQLETTEQALDAAAAEADVQKEGLGEMPGASSSAPKSSLSPKDAPQPRE